MNIEENYDEGVECRNCLACIDEYYLKNGCYPDEKQKEIVEETWEQRRKRKIQENYDKLMECLKKKEVTLEIQRKNKIEGEIQTAFSFKVYQPIQ